jgi:ribonuclease HI
MLNSSELISFYTDGATEGHNGKLGTVTHCGIGVWCPYLNLKCSERIKAISNNEAEFYALIKGMQIAIKHNLKNVHFFLDSLIVVNRAKNPSCKTKNKRMNALSIKIAELTPSFEKIKFDWIPREQNTTADLLSKKSLLKKYL